MYLCMNDKIQFWTFLGEAVEDKFLKILMNRLDKWL